jgi:glutamate synthase domain-containing protein 1
MLFMPKECDSRKKCVAIIEQLTASEGHRFLGWRDVPTNEGALGELARSTCPHISQFFVEVDPGDAPGDAVDQTPLEGDRHHRHEIEQHDIAQQQQQLPPPGGASPQT